MYHHWPLFGLLCPVSLTGLGHKKPKAEVDEIKEMKIRSFVDRMLLSVDVHCELIAPHTCVLGNIIWQELKGLPANKLYEMQFGTSFLPVFCLYRTRKLRNMTETAEKQGKCAMFCRIIFRSPCVH